MARTSSQRRRIEIIAGLCVLVVFGVVYYLVLSTYQSETRENAAVFSTGRPAHVDYVAIDAKLTTIDPVKGDLVLRLQFAPQGAWLNPDQVTLARPIVLEVNSASGQAEYLFKPGERMNPAEVLLNLDGDVSNYPFDVHQAELIILMGTPVTTTMPLAGAETVSGGYASVPFTVNYTGSLIGYKIQAYEGSGSTVGYAEIATRVSRSFIVISFAVFIMGLQWSLALAALLVTLAVVLRGRRAELGMFGWLGALLFALVPLRNAMPNVPPIGVLSDYAAFFWAEEIVASCLVVLVLTWLRRPPAETSGI